MREAAHELAATGRRFAAFLRRPTPEPPGAGLSPIRETAYLFVVCIGLTVTAGLLLTPLILIGDAGPSQGLRGVLSTPPFRLIIAVVILGPITEEIAFRSWLTGTRGQVAAGAAFVLILFGGGAALHAAGIALSPQFGYSLVALAIAAYLILSRVLDGSERARWFILFFPAIFWGHALVFGTLHLPNYTGSLGPMLLAFTIPQIIAGLVFGYARLRIGLMSAISLHMAFNAIPVAGLLIAKMV